MVAVAKNLPAAASDIANVDPNTPEAGSTSLNIIWQGCSFLATTVSQGRIPPPFGAAPAPLPKDVVPNDAFLRYVSAHATFALRFKRKEETNYDVHLRRKW